jgi:hypothetical protein
MVDFIRKYGLLGLFVFLVSFASAQQQNQWLQFTPKSTASNGKHIVLLSGDEEYRTEESFPMLAKILTEHHGFKTTVVFAIHPETGLVDPDYTKNLPGIEHLASADLLIIGTRFRELPDQQMKYIDDYLKAGKPIIGLRTATHAFNYGKDSKSPYAKYGYSSKQKGWEGGFGKKVLGETWINHHGIHGKEGTRGLVDGIKKENNHPILKGVNDIWGPTDVYGITGLASDAEVLLWGQSTHGMTAESPGSWEKSIMPVAWTKSYALESGKKGKVFTTTMGSAIDFLNEDLRRLIVNASYWALGIEEKSPEKANVNIVGTYHPTMFGFGGFQKGKLPKDFIN